MRKRRNKPHGKENNERWLVTYSDLITLLLIFFVIMYAMSNIDVAKFLTLSESLNAALDPSNQIPLQNLGTTALLADQNPSAGHQTGAQVTSLSKPQLAQFHAMLKEDEVFSHLFARLKSYINKHGLSQSVSVQNQQRGIQITLRDVVFFQTGEDTLRSGAQQDLLDLAPFLKQIPNNIVVEGFTDNVPIHTAMFPSNWELSVGRAVNVVKYLIASGISPQRLAATGYGQFHPLVPNTSDYNRQLNRRVNIVILRSWVASLEESPTTIGGSLSNSSLTALHQRLGNNPHTALGQNEPGTVQQKLPPNLFGNSTKQ